MKSKKGFTLIELLVVIAIIGILTTIAVVALNNARAKARDAKRVADVKQVQTALELFFNDKGRYPTALEFASGSIYSTSSNGTTTYMAVIPAAPSPTDSTCTADGNSYVYTSNDAGTDYKLSFCLGGATGALVPGDKCATASSILNRGCGTIPSDISDLKLWLDASDASTLYTDACVSDLVQSDSDQVACWRDKSSMANNAEQADPTFKPIYSTNQLNSLSTLAFSSKKMFVDDLVLNDDFSIFAVYSASLDDMVYGGWPHTLSYYWDAGAPQYIAFRNDGEVGPTISNTLWGETNEQYGLNSTVVTGGQVYEYINGHLLGSDAFSGNFTISSIGMAYDTYYMSGYIAELVVYDNNLSDSERVELETYFGNKYGIEF